MNTKWKSLCTILVAGALVSGVLLADEKVLARVDGWPVLVRQQNALASTFHPELTDDLRIHRMLLEMIPAEP